MKDSSETVKMSSANLSRVEDLERSPQWTSLTNEINDLEKLCRLNNHQHSRRQPLKYNYHRRSVPQMQKATSVWIEPNDELNQDPNNDFSKSNTEEAFRWSWRPKTEFERTYFFDDYSNDQFYYDTQKRYSPISYSDPFNQKGSPLESQNLSRRSDQSRDSSIEDKFTQIYNRIYDNEPPYSGTRERLHEIFERNRYLRRKFFASIPSNDASNYAGDFPKPFESKTSRTVSKCNGFGSTETITSQSNQSSISSSDRKSRCQVNVTSELAEEESCNNEFSYSDGYSKNSSNVEVNHLQGGRIMSSTRDGKLLVNIVPGNEVYVAKRSISFKEPPSVCNFNVDDDLATERQYRGTGNPKSDTVEVHHGNNEYASNTWSNCHEYENSRREIEKQSRRREVHFSDDTIDQQAKFSSQELLQPRTGGDTKTENSQEYDFAGENRKTNIRMQTIKTQGQKSDPESFYPFQSDYVSGKGTEMTPVSGSDQFCTRSINRDESSVKDSSIAWSARHECDPQDLCKSLPNLSFYEKTSNYPSQDHNFTVNTGTDPSFNRGAKFETKSELSVDALQTQAKEENKRIHKCFSSQIDLPNCTANSSSLTLRKVKITRVPPPLDMSKVNERYEEVEALERKRMNAVDIYLHRNYDCPLKGEPTMIQEECSSSKREDSNSKNEDSIREASSIYRNEWSKRTTIESENCVGKDDTDSCGQTKKEKSSSKGSLHKLCGDLSAVEDLQSPQLVNNYKNSMIDLRTSGSTLSLAESLQMVELEMTQEKSGRAPLFDRVDSINDGPQAGSGSTLPSVYGPIPYSQ